MSIQHFKSLLFRSAKIQEEIEKEHQRRWPNWMRLLKLKKLRLAIKDKMQRLVQKNMHVRLKPLKSTEKNFDNNHWQSA